MSITNVDTCPRCGAPMLPVLDSGYRAGAAGPVSADPPFRLSCTTCPTLEAPPLTSR